jgi:hypothetical protein
LEFYGTKLQAVSRSETALISIFFFQGILLSGQFARRNTDPKHRKRHPFSQTAQKCSALAMDDMKIITDGPAVITNGLEFVTKRFALLIPPMQNSDLNMDVHL